MIYKLLEYALSLTGLFALTYGWAMYDRKGNIWIGISMLPLSVLCFYWAHLVKKNGKNSY